MKTTICKAVTKTCYKHSMGGGGGSYSRTVIPRGAVVEIVSESESSVLVKYNGKVASVSRTNTDAIQNVEK